MKLAVNYSKQAADLLQAGQLDFDLFKCCPDPEWLPMAEEARRLRPIYFHFTLHTGIDQIQTAPWELYLKLQAETQTPYINLHLLSPAPILDGRPGIPHVAAVLTELRPLVSVVGPGRVILENLPFPMDGAYGQHPIADPDSIHEIVTSSRCGFLLDLSHAVLAARYLGIDEKQYLSALPVGALSELHLSGLSMRNGQWDDHFGFSEDDWRLVEWAFDQIHTGLWAKPDIVAFEYGGFGPAFEFRSDSNVLLEQVPRLQQLVRISTPA